MVAASVVAAGPAVADTTLTVYASALGGGDCTTATSPCTLPAAFAQVVQAGGGTVELTEAGVQSDPSTWYQGPLVLSGSAGISVYVQSDTGGADPIFDGGGQGSVLTVTGGLADLYLEGVTLQNGVTSGDGGAISSDSPLSLDTVTMNGNRAANGGAVYVGGAHPSLSMWDSTADGNTATGNGGAIDVGDEAASSNFSVWQSDVSSNTAGANGGAIDSGQASSSGTSGSALWASTLNNDRATDGGAIAIDDAAQGGTSQFSLFTTTLNNDTAVRGGAVDLGDNNGPPNNLGMYQNTLTGDTATGDGGAVNVGGGTPQANTFNIYQNTFSTDTAGDNGGAISALDEGAGNPAVFENTISGTTAGSGGSGDGGAIEVDGPDAQVFANTISNAHAAGNGGAIDLPEAGPGPSGAGMAAFENTVTSSTAGDAGGGLNMTSSSPSDVLFQNTFQSDSATQGGGVQVNGPAETYLNTFAGDTAAGPGGGINMTGGGGGDLWDSTFYQDAAGAGSGGAISYQGANPTDTLSMWETTLSSDSADTGHPALAGPPTTSGGGTLRLASSILANSTASCATSTTIVDGGYNLADDATCPLTAPGSQSSSGIGAQLGAVGNNGGITATIPINLGSSDPAFHRIPASFTVQQSSGQTAPACQQQSENAVTLSPPCSVGSFEAQLNPASYDTSCPLPTLPPASTPAPAATPATATTNLRGLSRQQADTNLVTADKTRAARVAADEAATVQDIQRRAVMRASTLHPVVHPPTTPPVASPTAAAPTTTSPATPLNAPGGTSTATPAATPSTMPGATAQPSVSAVPDTTFPGGGTTTALDPRPGGGLNDRPDPSTVPLNADGSQSEIFATGGAQTQTNIFTETWQTGTTTTGPPTTLPGAFEALPTASNPPLQAHGYLQAGAAFAPSVAQIGGQYVMWFSGSNVSHAANCLDVATSPDAAGPYTIQGNPWCDPLQASYDMGDFDPSIYIDGAGQPWLLYSQEQEYPQTVVPGTVHYSAVHVVPLSAAGTTIDPPDCDRTIATEQDVQAGSTTSPNPPGVSIGPKAELENPQADNDTSNATAPDGHPLPIDLYASYGLNRPGFHDCWDYWVTISAVVGF